jgi:hypothetical protein
MIIQFIHTTHICTMHTDHCRLDDSGKGVKAVTAAAATVTPVLGAGRTAVIASTSSLSLAADARVVLKYTTVADGTNQPRYAILHCDAQ